VDDHNDAERLFVGRCALLLFIGGLLVPFILAVLVLAGCGENLSPGAKNTAYGLSFGFGVVAELLALILGTIGRRNLSGRTAQLGVVVLLAASAVLSALGCAVWLVLSLPAPAPKPEFKTPKPAEKADVSPDVMPKEAGR